MLEVVYPQECTEYKLSHAMLFYQGNGHTMATLHKVNDRQLLAGKSVSLQDVEDLFHSEGQQQKMVVPPPEVIAWSRNEIIWFEKSRIRPIYFNAPEAKRQFLNKISGKNVIWPNLIFRISKNNIFCWAVKSKAKPGINARLYNAPFSNIFQNHRFCPPTQFHELREENMMDFARKAVELFFRGHFSHLYDNMLKSITYQRGRDRFWVKMEKDLENGRIKSFPNRYLVSANMTVKDILS